MLSLTQTDHQSLPSSHTVGKTERKEKDIALSDDRFEKNTSFYSPKHEVIPMVVPIAESIDMMV